MPAQQPLPPPRAGPGVKPQCQEAPQGKDPGVERMAAHRHDDTLALGSRPWEVERKRESQRFNLRQPEGAPFLNGPPSLA